LGAIIVVDASLIEKGKHGFRESKTIHVREHYFKVPYGEEGFSLPLTRGEAHFNTLPSAIAQDDIIVQGRKHHNGIG